MNLRYSFLLLALAALMPALGLTPALHAAAAATTARTPKSSGPRNDEEKDAKKPKTIAEVVGSNKKFEGLFTLYQDKTNGGMHLLVKQAQLGNEFIYFTQTRDGVLAAGHFRGAFQDNRIFSLRKHFNRIEFVSENTSFYW